MSTEYYWQPKPSIKETWKKQIEELDFNKPSSIEDFFTQTKYEQRLGTTRWENIFIWDWYEKDKNFSDLKTLYAFLETGEIRDEYGRLHELHDFWAMATKEFPVTEYLDISRDPRFKHREGLRTFMVD